LLLLLLLLLLRKLLPFHPPAAQALGYA